MADGFLGRWSKRKAGIGEKQDSSLEKKVEVPSEASSALPAEKPVEEVAPPATLEDVAKIDRFDPDFSAFMKPDVDPVVQQAALKKMFTDPHFNIMDGLDIYIDDYSKPDPLPPGMLERMAQSDMLNLFRKKDEEPAPQDGALAAQEKSDLISTQNISAISQAAPLDEVPNEVQNAVPNEALGELPVQQEQKKT